MAQTGYTPILIYSSSTASAAPAAGNLTNSTLGSELAINITDGKLFYKDNANAVQVIGWKVVPTSAGGTGLTSFSSNQVFYASSTSVIAQSANLAFDGNNLSIGGTSSAAVRLYVGGTADSVQTASPISYFAAQAFSNATTSGFSFRSSPTTAANGGTPYTITNIQHFIAQAGSFNVDSTVTNQFGFNATSALTGATNNYGFYGNIAAATGRWNLYMNGTANNYMAGPLGIGTTSIGGTTGFTGLRANTNLTGATTCYGIASRGAIQSDVTGAAYFFTSFPSTQDAAFTLTNLIHYGATQGTITGGSRTAPTNQYGFQVDSSLTGATNNYGFHSNIASAANRYNFYAAGTAANWFSGDVLVFGAGGLGYTTGSGGAITQGTSRTQGVTLDKTNGAITLFSAAGSATYQSFTVTNNKVAATDTIIVNQKSGTDKYIILVTNVAAGSFQITYATTGGTTTEQPVFNFAVIKAVAA